ncbi:hypothetical protein KC845_00180 [Candidatus Kaiserbacteria bacterium]|nr:hypothetical protein [Candidatus Kaiserbacteria bacterium]
MASLERNNLPLIQENPYLKAEERPEGTKYNLSSIEAQIALARMWFKLHPELYPEPSDQTGIVSVTEILKKWTTVTTASATYREYVELASHREEFVDISDDDALAETLRQMGLIKTIH